MENDIRWIERLAAKNGIDISAGIRRFKGGQINRVYQVGSSHVVKIENDLDVTRHQPEIVKLAVSAGAKVPAILDSGEMDGSYFLLMEKAEGRKLADDWISFSDAEKTSMMRQIADQMKIFHSITFGSYALPRTEKRQYSWQAAMDAYTTFEMPTNKELDQETVANFSALKKYYLEHHTILQTASVPALVHNDLHFENILHVDGELTGILDFDFARQAPREYELRQILDFFCTPVYYVEEKLEDAWRGFVVNEEISSLKKCYPELFEGQDLITRLKLYITESLMGDLQAGANMKFNERFGNYFKNDWLERHL